jgi:hypothetical protein
MSLADAAEPYQKLANDPSRFADLKVNLAPRQRVIELKTPLVRRRTRLKLE